MPTAIPDSSVLISLAAIGRFHLVEGQNERVVVPPAVMREVVAEGQGYPGSEQLRTAVEEGRIEVEIPKNRALVAALKTRLGDGESEVIALGTEMKDALVLLDDKAARASARELELKQTGIVGILLRAKHRGEIESMQSELKKLRDEVGFRLSGAIVAKILAECGEVPED